MLVGVVVCAAAFYAPNLWLSSRVTARQRADRARRCPTRSTCSSPASRRGSALDAAAAAGLRRDPPRAPILAEELELTLLEVKAGIPRVDAFRRLAERTGVDDLK